jgi:PAS domain S-box-containing protein
VGGPNDQQAGRAARQALLLVENVVDYAIFGLNRAGCVTSWNAGAERIKGYRAEEIIGQHFSRFYPAEDVQAGKCGRLLAAAARYGRSEDEGWRVRKGGSRFWASVVINAVRDEGGELVGYAKVTRDLTERRSAEDERLRRAKVEEANRLQGEIRRRERDARAAVEEAESALLMALLRLGDAIIATDGNGDVTRMNAVAERLTGWKLAEAHGQQLPAVFHVIGSGLVDHTVLISRTGVETLIQYSSAPIQDAVGYARGIVLVFRDASATCSPR